LIPATGRVIGFDLGAARIGVAICDSHQRVASALATVSVAGDVEADRGALARLVAEEEAVGVVVGLPLSLDGSVGPAARRILDEIPALTARLGGLEVETVDERFTTVTANQALRAGVGSGEWATRRAAGGGGRSRPSGGPARRSGGGARRGAEARQRVDSVAATLLLQSWLDRRGARGVAE
jgi:putative holliday junction resolvase